jgi:hypothetical protein
MLAGPCLVTGAVVADRPPYGHGRAREKSERGRKGMTGGAVMSVRARGSEREHGRRRERVGGPRVAGPSQRGRGEAARAAVLFFFF